MTIYECLDRYQNKIYSTYYIQHIKMLREQEIKSTAMQIERQKQNSRHPS